MKLITPLLLFFCVAACQHPGSDAGSKAVEQQPQEQQPKKNTFFPVTSYLKGQIAGLKNAGVNPLKRTDSLGHKDSAWLKVENFESEFAEFVSPVIDSTGWESMFKEASFLDQTINAVTLTYDPVKPLPDSISLQRWDIYIDPDLNTVKRIYILKKVSPKKFQQLTWEANKSCKKVYISKAPSGKDYVEKEITITWDF